MESFTYNITNKKTNKIPGKNTPIRYRANIGNTTQTHIVEFKHKIEPIKNEDGSFTPNYAEEHKAILMLPKHFRREQIEGNTILVNFSGGWCTLTKDMVEVK